MESNTNDATRLINFELAEYERRNLELKAQGNTYSPIARLLDEILLEIFAVLKANLSIQKWHHIAHICRHWRCVATEAANLWTNPPTSSHDYTLVMLERSQNSLLEIFIDKATAQATTDVILKHLGRINSLTLVQDKEGLAYFQDRLIDTAVQLRKLAIYNYSLPFSDTPPPFRLSPRQTTSLQSLHLSFMDVDWQILPIRGLQSLCMAYMRISNPPSWREFQKALDGMPSLEKFQIGLPDFQLDPPGHSLLQPLNMPHLRQLAIFPSANSVITHFLSNTTLPQLRQLDATTSDAGGYQDIIHTMAAKMDIGLFDCLFLGSGNCTLSQTAPLTDRLSLKFSPSVIEEDPALAPRLARSIMAELAMHPTSRIMNLELDVNMTSNELLEILGYNLPYLESIQVFSFWKVVIDSLIVPRTHSPGEPIPFASLQTIRLEEVYESDNSYTSEPREPLCECLRTRLRHHSPVAKVFVDCELTLEQVCELRELVSDLQFAPPVESETEQL